MCRWGLGGDDAEREEGAKEREEGVGSTGVDAHQGKVLDYHVIYHLANALA